MKFSSAEYDEYIKHIEAELKRMRPVYRAAMRWYAYYSRSDEQWGDGFPLDSALARSCACAERAKRKK